MGNETDAPDLKPPAEQDEGKAQPARYDEARWDEATYAAEAEEVNHAA